jgi:uncharacterized protein YbjT (DUF2867 family)
LEDYIAETVAAEITKPDIAAKAFSGVHTVISSVGITRQRDGLTYDQVDYGGNLNLLQAAERAGVKSFIYVSVVGADRDVDVPVIQAKRRFEKVLIDSALKWQIVRPSGFFTDMTDVWRMALRGTIHLFGDGQSKISPIDPLDLAEAIADRREAKPGQILANGGSANFTWNEIAELACQVAGKSCTIRHWPKWLLRAILAITRVISRPTYGTLSFLGHVMTNDTTAPNHGYRNLEAFFRAQQEAEVQ